MLVLIRRIKNEVCGWMCFLCFRGKCVEEGNEEFLCVWPSWLFFSPLSSLSSLGGENLAVAQNTYSVLWFKGKELNFVFGLLLSVSRIVSVVNKGFTGVSGTSGTTKKWSSRIFALGSPVDDVIIVCGWCLTAYLGWDRSTVNDLFFFSLGQCSKHEQQPEVFWSHLLVYRFPNPAAGSGLIHRQVYSEAWVSSHLSGNSHPLVQPAPPNSATSV